MSAARPHRPKIFKLILGLAVAAAVVGLLEIGARLLEPDPPPRLGVEPPPDEDPDQGPSATPPAGFGDRMLRIDPATGELSPSFWIRRGQRLVKRLAPDGECSPFHCLQIPLERSPKELRVACFGGSTTAADASTGIPQNFCTRVGQKLRRLLPGRTVRVFNLGGVGISSARVLPVARETARLARFDLWLVYAGHNEFIHSRKLVRHDLLAAQSLAEAARRSSALMRAIHGALGRLRSRPEGGQRRYSGQLLRTTEGHAREMKRLLGRYAKNMRALIRLAREHRTPLVASELVANLFWAPLASDQQYYIFDRQLPDRDITRLLATFRRGRALEQQRRYREALAVYDQAAAIDPAYVPVALRKGKILELQGNTMAALRLFVEARARNRFPSVASPELNNTLRAVCREHGLPLAAQTGTFHRIYREDPAAYYRLFLDDCHPSNEGHRLIAENIFAAIRGAGLFGL